MDQATSRSSTAGLPHEYNTVISSELKFIGQNIDDKDNSGKYMLMGDEEDFQNRMYDKPLSCFGCGIGWFSFLLGFLCPLMWYYATVLYISNNYRKDPRERAGLAASAIAALIFTVTTFIIIIISSSRRVYTVG